MRYPAAPLPLEPALPSPAWPHLTDRLHPALSSLPERLRDNPERLILSDEPLGLGLRKLTTPAR